jgi:hypothetical protein
MPFFNWRTQRDQHAADYGHQLREIDRAVLGPYGENAALYRATKEAIEAANFPDPTNFAKRLLVRFVERIENELKHPCPRYNICIQLVGTAAEFYALEGFTILPPDPSGFTYLEGNITIGIIRDHLLRLQSLAARPQQTLETLYSTLTESSKWLFIGQLAASLGFVIYSWQLGNWVFVVTNVLMLLTAGLGQCIYLGNKKGVGV